ncbi:putative UPF0481 protein At3g02645 [Gastrolobium bilobum]|uniref:putative UPF0481 protein At3g02645 n=1 Tax=Gastrolobium bilobum TaxID=150636 RepID=UPI002AB223C7|nr:putative UPF0481 protein At3g02645 [Gastrolobium bilobum]
MASDKTFPSKESKPDENPWLIQLKEMLSETNLGTLKDMPVCIHQVPKSLSCAKPEAFTPQIIAIGPYNQFRPEIYPLQRFKNFSAQRVLEHFKHDIDQLVEKLNNTVSFVRACYHKYLHIDENTLLYTMAIDGLFLLYFFHNYLDEKESFLKGIDQQLEKNGVKHTKDDIIRDMLMVDNQIPTFILRRILILMIERSKPDDQVYEILGPMLLSFCKKHCPLKLTQTWSKALAMRYHLLDLMYHLVVPENEKSETTATSEIEGMRDTSATDAPKPKKCSISEGIDKFKKKVNVPIKGTRDYLKNVKDMNVPLLLPIKPCIDGTYSVLNLCQSCTSESPFDIEAPKVVLIPSVRKLHSVGIRCKPSEGGINTIHFDKRKCILYLPVIELDVNSEVIMRNLVAYEALTQPPNSFIFTRYTELMGAMIGTVKDVKLLKDADIIEKTSSLSVEGTLELFNGMNKFIGPTNTVKSLDETIEKVNKCFRKKQKFSLRRSFTNCVNSYWQFLTFLATVVLLAMTAFQTFCTVYDCPSHFRHK